MRGVDRYQDKQSQRFLSAEELANLTRALTKVEADGVRLHDLRHTFASFGAAGGLSLPLIAAILGHKDVKTTQQYAHLADSPVKAAAGRTAAAASGAMKGVAANDTAARLQDSEALDFQAPN